MSCLVLLLYLWNSVIIFCVTGLVSWGKRILGTGISVGGREKSSTVSRLSVCLIEIMLSVSAMILKEYHSKQHILISEVFNVAASYYQTQTMVCLWSVLGTMRLCLDAIPLKFLGSTCASKLKKELLNFSEIAL